MQTTVRSSSSGLTWVKLRLAVGIEVRQNLKLMNIIYETLSARIQ
jgi:hypothetical protein